jgi:hypothetical protein
MKNINLKNIAISSLIAASTCFAMVGTASAASQPDTHHLTQKQKDAIAAKQKAKHNAELKAKQKAKHNAEMRAKAKHEAESKHHSDPKAKEKARHDAEMRAKAKHDAEMRAKEKAKHKEDHHDSKAKDKDSKFEQDRKNG